MVPVELQDLMIHGLVHQEILTLQGEAVAGELAVVKFGQLYSINAKSYSEDRTKHYLFDKSWK